MAVAGSGHISRFVHLLLVVGGLLGSCNRSLDPVVGFPEGLHHLIRPSRPIVEQDHESASRFCWCEATELPPASLCPGNKRLKLTILVTLSLVHSGVARGLAAGLVVIGSVARRLQEV